MKTSRHARNDDMTRTLRCCLAAIVCWLAPSTVFAQPCSYTVTPPVNVALYNGDVLTGSMTTAPGCTWTVRSTVPWAAVAGISSASSADFNFVKSGDGYFFVHVGATDRFSRSGMMTVLDGAGAPISTFNVSQQASPFPGVVEHRSDFDGDGRSDVSIWRPGNGVWYPVGSNEYFTNGTKTGVSPQQWGVGAENDVPVSGDYDGDWMADFGIWRPSNGTWYVLTSSTNYASYFTVQWGADGDIPVQADYDFDGRMDLAVWRPSTGIWYILRSTTNYNKAMALVRAFGLSTDLPKPADFDGDGATDIAVYRPSTGVWHILRSWLNYNTEIVFTVQWGVNALGDVPLPADYDGDAIADPAIWRPDSGLWYILRSSTSLQTFRVEQWGVGAEGDVPIAEDYSGDGIADLAIWRPVTGVWYVKLVGVGPYFSMQWGVAAQNDVVVP